MFLSLRLKGKMEMFLRLDSLGISLAAITKTTQTQKTSQLTTNTLSKMKKATINNEPKF